MKKRGRKAGTTSFVQVSLDDLNKCLKPNAKVIVWNRYASMIGLEGKAIEAKPDVLIAAANSGGIDISFSSFEGDKLTEDKAKENAEHQHHFHDLVPKPEVSLEIF